ncbi:MAG: T9SS type A sorting domain-containing protein [Flavobacteriales bacterium]|nr:T9SS type A sorting domain-containing protein [Flavobacteriales bacterium]MBP6697019.1 T9SS type A sorting domain-containing protein [Flavobacteriales bacterium]
MNFAAPISRHAALVSGLALATPTGLCAQASCGDLVVEHMWYAAFDSTAVEVVLTNNDTLWFSGPSMELVDNDLDTIAGGQLNWFVLPPGTNTHTLPLFQGMTLPETPFTGEAILHYQTLGGPESCILPLSAIELCPPLPCTQLYLGVHQTDTAVIATIDWSVVDSDGNTAASGSIELDTLGPWQRIDTLCLPPGDYELHIEPAVLSPFGEFYCQLFRDPQVYPNPTVLINGSTSGHLPFSYYAPCAEGENAIEEPAPNTLQCVLVGNLLHLSSTTAQGLDTIELFDVHGSSIAQRKVNSSMTTFDLTGQAPGLYIICAQNGDAATTQRFILH